MIQILNDYVHNDNHNVSILTDNTILKFKIDEQTEELIVNVDLTGLEVTIGNSISQSVLCMSLCAGCVCTITVIPFVLGICKNSTGKGNNAATLTTLLKTSILSHLSEFSSQLPSQPSPQRAISHPSTTLLAPYSHPPSCLFLILNLIIFSSLILCLPVPFTMANFSHNLFRRDFF